MTPPSTPTYKHKQQKQLFTAPTVLNSRGTVHTYNTKPATTPAGCTTHAVLLHIPTATCPNAASMAVTTCCRC
jgi:hypothetical protein